MNDVTTPLYYAPMTWASCTGVKNYMTSFKNVPEDPIEIQEKLFIFHFLSLYTNTQSRPYFGNHTAKNACHDDQQQSLKTLKTHNSLFKHLTRA